MATIMKDIDVDALRVQSLGCDDEGNVYWYFYGTRLYKEERKCDSKVLPLLQCELDWCDQQKSLEKQKRRRGRPRKKSTGDEIQKSTLLPEESRYLMLDTKSRWSVVCATLDEWELFSRKFENSKKECEIALYNVVTKKFLPTLGSLYNLKDPVQLSLIKKKIEPQEYNNQIDQDFHKMVSNSRIYHGKNSELTTTAKTVWNTFRTDLTQNPSSAKHTRKFQKERSKRECLKPLFISNDDSSGIDIKGKKKNHRRKKKSNAMKGLDLLAVASEKALKDVGRFEKQALISGGLKGIKNSKSFPGLKITLTQNHAENLISEMAGCSSQCAIITSQNHKSSSSSVSNMKNDANITAPIAKELIHNPEFRASAVNESNSDHKLLTVEEPRVIDQLLKDTAKHLFPDSSIMDSFPPGALDTAKSLQELEDTCHILGIGNVSHHDSTSYLSSPICKIIKKSQDCQIGSGIGVNDDLGEVSNSRSSLDSPEDKSIQLSSLPEAQGQVSFSVASPFSHDVPIIPAQVYFNNDVALQPLGSLSTVDASILGISCVNDNRKTNLQKSDLNAIVDGESDLNVTASALKVTPEFSFSKYCETEILSYLPNSTKLDDSKLMDSSLFLSDLTPAVSIPNAAFGAAKDQEFLVSSGSMPRSSRLAGHSGTVIIQPNLFLRQLNPIANFPLQINNSSAVTNVHSYSNLSSNSQPTYITSFVDERFPSFNSSVPAFSISRSSMPIANTIQMRLPLPNVTRPYAIGQGQHVAMNYLTANSASNSSVASSLPDYSSNNTSTRKSSTFISEVSKMNHFSSAIRSPRDLNSIPAPVTMHHKNRYLDLHIGNGHLSSVNPIEQCTQYIPTHKTQKTAPIYSTTDSTFIVSNDEVCKLPNDISMNDNLARVPEFLTVPKDSYNNCSVLHSLPPSLGLPKDSPRCNEIISTNAKPNTPAIYNNYSSTLHPNDVTSATSQDKAEELFHMSNRNEDTNISNSSHTALPLPIKNAVSSFPIFYGTQNIKSNLVQPNLSLALSNNPVQFCQPRHGESLSSAYVIQANMPSQIFPPSCLNLPHHAVPAQPIIVPSSTQLPFHNLHTSVSQQHESEVLMNKASYISNIQIADNPLDKIVQNSKP